MKRPMMICALSLILHINAASAALIVDTGEPPDILAGLELGSYQWLSGQFTISHNYTITDVEGWMFGLVPCDITVAIYGDSGDLPDSDSMLYSETFNTGVPSGANNAWLGVHGVSWDLGPGTYWAVFGILSGYDFFNMPYPAPFPLDNYAYTLGPNMWVNTVATVGIRIYGDEVQSVDPVPVPGAIILGSIGAGLITWIRRSRTI